MIGKLLRRIAEGETLSQQELDALQMLADKLEALTTYAEVSQWLDSLGVMRAGEFRSGGSAEPGSGFSGVRIGNPPFTYNSELWNIVGVNNDKLSFGLNADDGSAYAAGGLLTLNENGITVGSSGVAMRLNPGVSDEFGGWYLGGLNIGTSLRFGVHSFGLITSEMIGEGFESGGLSAWTTTGSPSVTTDEAADGSYSCIISKSNYISKTFTVVDGVFYLVSLKVRHTVSAGWESIFHLTGTGIAADYPPNPILVDTAGVWSKHLYLLKASGTSMTLNFRGWASGTTEDNIYIDTISMGGVAYSYQGTLLDGVGSYALAASSSIRLLAADTSTILVNSSGVTITGNVSATNLSGTNTGNQTSIVGITGTIAQFDTAITDATLSGNNTGDQIYFVPLTTKLTSTSWDGDARSTTAKTVIDLSAVFGAPAGIKAIAVRLFANDSGSAAGTPYFGLSPNNTANDISISAYLGGHTNDALVEETGICPCDANGDVYYQVLASGASTLDAYIQITGYWI